MNKKDDQLINSLYKKLSKFKNEGLKIRHLKKRFVHGNLFLLIILVILKKIKDAKL